MAGNARFHDKLHRKNHHTNPTVGYADSASDPIASPSEPFQGDFIINGKLSASSGAQILSANITGDVHCNDMHVNGITYTNYISGDSTETIISDGSLIGNGDNTLTLDYQNGIYGKSPFFSISNTLCSLGTITSPSATFNTLTVKTSTNLNGPLSTLGNTNLNGTLTVTGSSTINGNLSVGNNVNIRGNLLVTGNLSALGDTTQIDTIIVSTSALSVINYGNSEALLVNQIANYPTAIFQKNGTNTLVISGTAVSVYGSISATGNINGNNINPVLTEVTANSAKWLSGFSNINFLTSSISANIIYINNTLSTKPAIGVMQLSASSSYPNIATFGYDDGNNNDPEAFIIHKDGIFVTSDIIANGDIGTPYGIVYGSNITILESASSKWNSVYSSVTSTSSNWDKTYNFLTFGGEVSGSFITSGDQTLSGNLGIGISALSAKLHVYDNSAYPAVKITQAGATGVALYIEDKSPDNTPTVIDYKGHMGIGTTTPNKELTVVGDISATGTIYTSNSSYSLSSNGYTKLPNGLLMQWGTSTCSSAGETTIVFPIPFTTSIYNVVTNPVNQLGSVANYSTVGSFGLTSFDTSVYDISANRIDQDVFWNAIGI